MTITPEQLAKSGTEHGHQAALFCYAATSGIFELKWLFAIPNGFYGSAAQKGKMKAEGLRSGVADICLPVNRDWQEDYDDTAGNSLVHYNGLFIEMKHAKYKTHKNGGLSDEQIEFSNFIIRQGYRFEVCYSWIEARDAILRYLGKV